MSNDMKIIHPPSDFRSWLGQQRSRADAIGQFARDRCEDPTWRGVNGPPFENIERYLRDKGADEETIDTARAAWTEFEVVWAVITALHFEKG